jgi:hypothetical protein
LAQSRVYLNEAVRFVRDSNLGLIFDLIGQVLEKRSTNIPWVTDQYKSWVDVIIKLPPGLKDISFNDLKEFPDRIIFFSDILEEVDSMLKDEDKFNLKADIEKIQYVLKKGINTEELSI